MFDLCYLGFLQVILNESLVMSWHCISSYFLWFHRWLVPVIVVSFVDVLLMQQHALVSEIQGLREDHEVEVNGMTVTHQMELHAVHENMKTLILDGMIIISITLSWMKMSFSFCRVQSCSQCCWCCCWEGFKTVIAEIFMLHFSFCCFYLMQFVLCFSQRETFAVDEFCSVRVKANGLLIICCCFFLHTISFIVCSILLSWLKKCRNIEQSEFNHYIMLQRCI